MTEHYISSWFALGLGSVKLLVCTCYLVFEISVLSSSENEAAFDVLYCITFKLMDHQWLAMRASYMDFNVSIFSGSLLFPFTFLTILITKLCMPKSWFNSSATCEILFKLWTIDLLGVFRMHCSCWYGHQLLEQQRVIFIDLRNKECTPSCYEG